MDVERVVVRLLADASLYTHVLDTATARLVYFGAMTAEIVGRSTLALATTYEKAAVSFEVMVGNVEKGKQILEDISQMAIETPFRTGELTAAVKELKAYGFETDQLMPVMRALGDVSAGTETELHRIVLAFGQVRNFGRLYGQELRQFVSAGIPIMESLAEVTGKNVTEIQSLVHAGRIGYNDVAAAFNKMTQAGGLYYDISKRINQETIFGRYESFKETLEKQGRNLGLAFFKAFNINSLLADMTESLGSMNTQGAQAIFTIAYGAIRDFIQLIPTAIREMQLWITQNRELIRTILLTVGAVLFIAAAIKGFIVTLTLLTTAIRIVGIVAALSSSLMSLGGIVAAISGMFSALAVTLTAILTPAGALIALLAAISYGMVENGAFPKLGTNLMDMFGLIKDTGINSWNAILEAIKGGDSKTALDIFYKQVEYGWKLLIIGLKAEWHRFSSEIGLELLHSLSRVAIEFAGFMGRQVLGIYSVVAPESAQRAIDDQNKKQEAALKELRGLIANAKDMNSFTVEKEIQDMVKNDMEGTKGLLSQLERLQVVGRVAGMLTNETGINLNRNLGSVGPGAVSMQAPDLKRVNPLADAYPSLLLDPQKMMAAKLTAELNRRVQEGYNDLYAKSVRSLIDLQKAVAGGAGKDVIQDLAGKANQATKQLEAFKNAVEASGRAARDGIRVLPDISPLTKQYVENLNKQIESGITPIDEFSKHMAALKEAFNGPVPGLMGLVGGLSVVGMALEHKDAANMAGIIDARTRDMGLYLEYEKLSRSLGGGDQGGKLPTTIYQGTQAAQDTINRSISQQITVEEKVHQTLMTALDLQSRTAKAAEETARALQKFDGMGLIPKGINNQGGGNP